MFPQQSRMSGKVSRDVQIINDFIDMCKRLGHTNIGYWTPECEYRIHLERIEYTQKKEKPRFIIMDDIATE